jgi:uncharacterized membrane protein YhaH (DUF805 family)
MTISNPPRNQTAILLIFYIKSGIWAIICRGNRQLSLKLKKGIVMPDSEQPGNVFQEYFINVLTKKYATFKGRARRKEYWFFYLFYTVISIVLSILAQKSEGVAIVLLLYYLVTILPGMGLTCRRLHDIGRSGWWMLVVLIPIVGPIVLFVWMCMDSQQGGNQYGPNPKGVSFVG